MCPGSEHFRVIVWMLLEAGFTCSVMCSRRSYSKSYSTSRSRWREVTNADATSAADLPAIPSRQTTDSVFFFDAVNSHLRRSHGKPHPPSPFLHPINSDFLHSLRSPYAPPTLDSCGIE